MSHQLFPIHWTTNWLVLSYWVISGFTCLSACSLNCMYYNCMLCLHSVVCKVQNYKTKRKQMCSTEVFCGQSWIFLGLLWTCFNWLILLVFVQRQAEEEAERLKAEELVCGAHCKQVCVCVCVCVCYLRSYDVRYDLSSQKNAQHHRKAFPLVK